MDRGALFLDTFFKPDLIVRYLPDILKGMVVTVEIALLVVVAGIALGLALALVRSLRLRLINLPIIVFVDVARALPPLVVVLIVYFGLPNVGIVLPSFAVLWLVLSLLLAAVAEEIFWAGILSVRQGQWEAARSTGLTYAQTLFHVVLPQAVRLTVPPLTNRTIAITKNTALGTVIGVPEILNQATTAESFSLNATPLMMGAIAYLVLFVPVVIVRALPRDAVRLEARLDGRADRAVLQPRHHGAGRAADPARPRHDLARLRRGGAARARRRAHGRRSPAVRIRARCASPSRR